MKKFIWPLQKLLDIKTKQEDFARIELMATTEKNAIIRSRIMMQKTLLRNLFSELKQLDPTERTRRQQECFQYSHVLDSKIKALHQDLAQGEKVRQRKMDEIAALRKIRKSLEQLRSKALDRYRQQVDYMEQKELDEMITTSYARSILMQTS